MEHTHTTPPGAHHYNRGCRHPECRALNTERCNAYQRDNFSYREYKREHNRTHPTSYTLGTGRHKPSWSTR